jgi:hypothetical protein
MFSIWIINIGYRKMLNITDTGINLMSKIEELPERESRGYGVKNREYGRRDPSRRPGDTLYSQKLALTSPTSGCLSVGIVRSRTKITEFFFNTVSFGVE